MIKKTFLPIAAATALAFVACKNGNTESGNNTDTLAVESAITLPTEETDTVAVDTAAQAKEFATFFNAVRMGMTAEQVNSALAARPQSSFEWEGLTIQLDTAACKYDPQTHKLIELVYKTDVIGTGEYKFIGDGKQALYEQKEGAKTYEELNSLLERFATFVSKSLGCNVADCSMQEYSAMGTGWAGSIALDYYNSPKRKVNVGGETIELTPVYLRVTVMTPESYAG